MFGQQIHWNNAICLAWPNKRYLDFSLFFHLFVLETFIWQRSWPVAGWPQYKYLMTNMKHQPQFHQQSMNSMKLSFRYIHCTSQFTPKMKANAEACLLSSLVWTDSGIVVSQHCLESFVMKWNVTEWQVSWNSWL